jgi:hypothetical protein
MTLPSLLPMLAAVALPSLLAAMTLLTMVTQQLVVAA